MKGKSEREVAQSYPTLCNPIDSSLPGSSIHGIFQATVLEWGAIAFSGEGTISSIMSLPIRKNWMSLYLYQCFTTRVDFVPILHLAIERHFVVRAFGGGVCRGRQWLVLLSSCRQRTEMPLNILQCIVQQLPNKIIWPQMLRVPLLQNVDLDFSFSLLL